NLPQKYLLYVGSRKAYKNFGNFLVASKTILNEFDDIFIVCAGGGKFSKEEQYKINELGLTNKVKHFSITDQTLQYFYSNALAFIFPSLYEGFGIPILEAFASECPVLLSNTSSFPEVAGNAGLYFEPENIESIQEAIKKIITKEELRKELVSAGSTKLKEYSWEKTATQTKLIYESVL
ncbi:MAG: glycosyltransferase family 4 protein, partial [Ignavibacteriae bacterium]|nr:glycosyltransferase family 4 protein [Ignavibacteriota bacterium]